MAKKSTPPSPFLGRWRITSMEMWDQEFVDAEVEGYVEFSPNGLGCFQFGYVSGDINYRDSTRDRKPSVEWSWDGNDEMDAANGRGWAVIDGDKIHGVIGIHKGDESEFEAIRKQQKSAEKTPIKPVRKAKKTKLFDDPAVALAQYATNAYIDADHRGIKKKTVEQFPLDGDERATLTGLPVLPAILKKKLTKKAALTVVDVIRLVVVISESLVDAEPGQQVALLMISKKLKDCLQENIAKSELAAKATKPKSTGTVFQFKITLLEVKPPIWRRVQIKDGTLDKLHEHIQTSMGWTNSHLHRFKFGELRYADPMLMEEDFEDFGYRDSTTNMLSDIIPKAGKRCQFLYEYDFGDGWKHEILFEGRLNAEVGCPYPLCLEGERACPPEDVGGAQGYADFLQAIQDKSHEEREEMFEWVDGWFDPEEFDPMTATKSMKKGLPDWRKEEAI